LVQVHPLSLKKSLDFLLSSKTDISFTAFPIMNSSMKLSLST
jgi:hypothetical protein